MKSILLLAAASLLIVLALAWSSGAPPATGLAAPSPRPPLSPISPVSPVSPVIYLPVIYG